MVALGLGGRSTRKSCDLRVEQLGPKTFVTQVKSQTHNHDNITTLVSLAKTNKLVVMGKKNKNKPRAVQDSATCSRINFLHQAAHLVPLPLQRHYLTTAKTAQKKTMLKLDPRMKRLTCRRCAALLAPGLGNAATRLTGGRGDEMVEVQCVHCGCVKRVRIVEGYTVWSERVPVETTRLRP